MIQRIQSVFLLISAMALAVFLGTNSYVKTISETEKVMVSPYNITHQVGQTLGTEKPIFYVAVMAIVAIIVSLLAIFQYKNRIRQVLFVAFNSLMMGATLAVTFYHITKDASQIGGEGTSSYEVGVYALIVALLSNSAANYFIKKDEKLVKSADRMR